MLIFYRHIVLAILAIPQLLISSYGLAQTTYSSTPSPGGYTNCVWPDLDCSLQPGSNNLYYGGQNVIRIQVVSISGNQINLKIKKCDGGTFQNSGHVNLRTSICDSWLNSFNSSEIQFSAGASEIPVTLYATSSFTSGCVDVSCALQSNSSPLSYYYTSSVEICASTVTCPTPSTPTGVSATALSPTSVNVSWNSSSNADDYEVYYCGSSFIGTTSSTSYTVNGLNPNTTYDFDVRAINDCGENSGYSSCSNSVTTPSGAPGTPSNPSNPGTNCGSATIYRTGTPPNGVSWYWQNNSCGTSTSYGQGSTFSASSSGWYYIRARNNSTGTWSSGCGSIYVSVTPNPNVNASSNSPVSTGSTINLSASNITGASYSWTGPGGWTATGQNPSRSNATTGMQGNYCVTATVSGCTDSDCEYVTVNQTPPGTPPTPSAPTNNCGSATLTRSGTPPTGVIWYWQGTSCGTSNSLGSGSQYTANSTGTYYIRAYDTNTGLWSTGCGSAYVSVTSNPNVNASSNSPVSTGSTINLSASNITGASYSWTGPGGWTATGQNPSRSNATTGMQGNYCVTATVSGCTDSDCEYVTVNQTPPGTPPTPSAPTNNCGSATLTRSGTPPTGVIWYWQGTSCGTSNSLGSGSQYTANSTGTYYIRAYDTNTGLWSAGCGSVYVSITSNPSVTASSNSPVDAGNTINLNASNVSGASYSWTGPNGWTSTSQNPSRSNATTAMDGQYCVTASVNGCTDQSCTNVVVNSSQLTLIGQQASPLSGQVNLTNFDFVCSVSGGNGNPITLSLEFEDYGGVSIPMPAPTNGSSSLTRVFSGVGNRPFRYKAVQDGQAYYFPSLSNPTPLYVEVTFDCANISQLPNFIPRSQWLKDYVPDWKYNQSINARQALINPSNIVVHHTGHVNHNTLSPYSNWASWIRSIYETHYNIHFGEYWQFDLPYNYMIDAEGNIYEGVSGGHSSVGRYHARNVWQNSIGIALLGQHEASPPTVEAMESLNMLLGKLTTELNIDPSGIVWNNALHHTHTDVAYTNQQLNGGIETILGHSDLQSDKPYDPGSHVHIQLPEIRSQILGCQNNNPLAYNALSLNNSGSFLSHAPLYRKRNGELEYLGATSSIGNRIVPYTDNQLVLGDTVVCDPTGYYSLNVPLSSIEFDNTHVYIPYFRSENQGSLVNPRLVRDARSRSTISSQNTFSVDAENLVGYDVLEDSVWVSYPASNTSITHTFMLPEVYDSLAYAIMDDHLYGHAFDLYERYVHVRMYSLSDTVYLNELMNYFADSTLLLENTYAVEIQTPTELLGGKLFVDEVFETLLDTNVITNHIRHGNSFLRVERFGYYDKTIHLSENDTAFELAMNPLPLLEDSVNLNFNNGQTQYWYNSSLMAEPSVGEIKFSKTYPDYTSIGVSPLSVTYGVDRVTMSSDSISLLGVLDQRNSLVLDSIYIMNVSDGSYSKTSSDDFDANISYVPEFQKVTCMSLHGNSEQVFIARKLPPTSLIPSITVQEDTPLMVSLSAFFTDPDSIPDDISFSLVGTGAGVSAQIMGDSIQIIPDANYNGSTTITLSSTHDWLTVQETFTIEVQPVNDPPTISELPPIEMCPSDLLTVDYTNFLSDVDNDLTDLIMVPEVIAVSSGNVSTTDLNVSSSGQSITFSGSGLEQGVFELHVQTHDGSDTSMVQTLYVTFLPPGEIEIMASDTIACLGQPITFWGTQGTTGSYLWEYDGLPYSFSDTIELIPNGVGAGTLDLFVRGWNGCPGEDEISIPVHVPPSLIVEPTEVEMCLGDSLLLAASGADFYSWSSDDTFLPTANSNEIIAIPTTNAVYAVHGWNSSSCADMDSVEISMNAVPPSPEIVDLGSTLYSTVPINIQWYLDGQMLVGETGQYLTPTTSGTYTVEYTDQNGCSAVSEPVTWLITGVRGHEATSVNVYPNPNNGTFTIEMTSSVLLGYQLFDAVGKLIESTPRSSTTGHITVSGISSGVYFLKVETENGVVVKKVVVR